MMIDPAPTVLLVEDDDVDAERVTRAAERAGAPFKLRRACDGVEALAVLRRESGPPLDRPYVILLDLKMPRMGGLQFLHELRKDEALRRTVVFVLSTSLNDEDRYRAYDSHVAGYIPKTQPDGDFGCVVQLLRHYLQIVALP